MPIRQLIAVVTLLLLGFAVATPARADSVAAFSLTPERLLASVASLIGLIGVVAGGLALARARRSGNAQRGGNLALLAGLISIAVGGLVVGTARGGLGTGHGLGGGMVALVLGSISLALAGLTRTRTRRAD